MVMIPQTEAFLNWHLLTKQSKIQFRLSTISKLLFYLTQLDCLSSSETCTTILGGLTVEEGFQEERQYFWKTVFSSCLAMKNIDTTE